ncbi:KilA-N domain-containing protein [Wielerella bovis]|uniref:KilA-N domain-containing protein n=1 Tax=Wielerella bovis TaxID=2917790 RepID=UPI0020183FE3|nr:KilA-N domain-containing protein [Wielerella bovis]ULJ66167.1 KilA-N domain-containing protein [Wielerella bovis]
MQNAISICNTSIREINGLYSLNDLHKASGGLSRHQPAFWLRNQQTKDLIDEISNSANLQSLVIHKAEGKNGGTFVCKELVIHYAMWISAKFSLQVIQTFLNTIENSGNLKTEKTTKDERTGLRQAVTMLVGKTKTNHSAAYKLVHHRFGVSSIEDLTHEQIPQAIEYVHRLILDGEVLDKPEPPALPTVTLSDNTLYTIGCVLMYAQDMRLFVRRYLPAFENLGLERNHALWTFAYDSEEAFLPVRRFFFSHLPQDKYMREYALKLRQQIQQTL